MVTATKTRPAWVELATDDPAAAQQFYKELLGWNISVSEDPQYGGYAMARLGGRRRRRRRDHRQDDAGGADGLEPLPRDR